MSAEKRYYVYVYGYPDGSVFYVGKGQGRRLFTHEEKARAGVHTPVCAIIRSLWAQGGRPFRAKVFTTDDEDEAYAKERDLIAFYGRATLVNKTGGGGSHSALARYTVSDAVLHRNALIALHRRGQPMPENTRRALIAANRGRFQSPKARAALLAAKLGKPRSDDTKRKLSDAQRGRKPTDEARAHMSLAQRTSAAVRSANERKRGHPLPETQRQAIAAASKGKPKSAATREAMRNAQRKRAAERKGIKNA